MGEKTPAEVSRSKNVMICCGIASAAWVIIVPIILYKITEGLPTDWNTWGDFSAGLFAPVAFLWLVAGYFLQFTELRNSIDEMKQTNDEMRAQSKAIEANELHARRDVFLKFAEFIREQMDDYALDIHKGTIQGHAVTSKIDANALAKLIYELRRKLIDNPQYIAHHFGPQSKNYLRLYKQLIDEANVADEKGLLAKMYTESEYGALNKLLKEYLVLD